MRDQRDRLGRLAAIVRTDFRIRFRRVSTLVIFLLISVSAYLWIPDPSTGRGILQVEGQRALYNSAAISMATAALGTILITLFGFYVVSNAVARDLRSRCGTVIAATRLTSLEYLAGKVVGNVAFLAAFTGGYMLVSMVMVLVRGEAPLRPLVFAWHYLLLAPPALVFVSTVAILFESIRWLSGRLGDVAWFFVWSIGMIVPVEAIESKGASPILQVVDFTGLGFVMTRLGEALGTTALSIGASRFDPSKEPLVLEPLSVPPEWIASRIVACLVPLVLLPVAVAFFHRFDPAKVRARATGQRTGRLGLLRRLARPLVRPLRLLRYHPRGGGASLGGAAREDAWVTLATRPLLTATLPVFAVLGVALPVEALRRGMLPVLFPVLGVLIAGMASRERRNGLLPMVFAAPRLKTGFVAWKMGGSLLVGLAFVAIPLARLVWATPGSAVALLVGTFFTCAAAVGLGVVSSNPKTFLALYLVFWYVVVDGGESTPALDYAGFYGTATPAVLGTYLALGTAFVLAAQLVHATRLRREGF